MGLSLLASQSRSGLGSLTLAVVVAAGWIARSGAEASSALPCRSSGWPSEACCFWRGQVQALRSAVSRPPAPSWGRACPPGTTRFASSGAFPLMGTGLNTYGSATLLYQTTSLSSHFQEAHNEYLQIAAEGGTLLVAAFALCVWRLIDHDAPALCGSRRAVAVAMGARWRRRRASWRLALQSLMEFSLQMPGNAALFAVVAALAVHAGAAEPERRPHRGAKAPPPHRPTSTRR